VTPSADGGCDDVEARIDGLFTGPPEDFVARRDALARELRTTDRARSDAVKAAAEQLYAELSGAGVEAFLDDRDERPGVLLADQELIGIPHRFVIGERGLKEGMVEYQHRRDAAATRVPLAEAAAFIEARLQHARASEAP